VQRLTNYTIMSWALFGPISTLVQPFWSAFGPQRDTTAET